MISALRPSECSPARRGCEPGVPVRRFQTAEGMSCDMPLSRPNGRVVLFTLSTDEKRSISLGRAEAIKLIAQVYGPRLYNGLCSPIGRFMPGHVHGRAPTARQHFCLPAAADGHSAKEVAGKIYSIVYGRLLDPLRVDLR